jgi:hypothetical protein
MVKRGEGTSGDGGDGGDRGDRWLGRPVLSAMVSVSIFVTPIVLSIVAATITAHLLPRPRARGSLAEWWFMVLAVPAVVLVATDRLARRALPLAVLLKMTMVFPDRAPKRLAVARQSGNTRDLARRVEEAKTHGIADEPVAAAEKILSLAGALNAHDRLTRGHGERVRALTDLIADELDLPTDDRDRLRWSALLHDIGKLAVHPDILNKPGKLDDAEWEVIKRHPLEGARLTAPLAGWLGEWANTIAEHHEKFDGTGYPHGLKGDEISLGGRIVAVADCYDTMTNVRTYKTSMSPKAARAELAACAGTHFDPKIVRAFLDVSIGRVRPLAGPLAWLGSLPFVSSIPQAVSVLGRVGAASVVATGAVAAGTLNEVPHRPATPFTGPVALPAATAPPASGAQSTNSAERPHGAGPDRGSVTTTTVAAAGGLGGGGAAGGGSDAGGPAGTTTTTTARATAPWAPTEVAVTAGNGGVTASWTAPSDGGSPITGYAVTPYVGGTAQDPHTFASPATSEVVGGLANGVTYSFTVTAINAVGSGPPSASSSPVTPVASSLAIVNGGAKAGRAQGGDQIIVTFSPAPSPALFCSAWSATSYPDLVDADVVVQGTHPSSGDDTVTVTDATDCNGGFHFGSIDLGQAGYFNHNASFGGRAAGCKNTKVSGCSSIHWDGRNTLTITLGNESSVQPDQTSPSVAVFTPDPALRLPSAISSGNGEQF